MLTLTIYSRKDCHLCDIARETLLRIQGEFPFSLHEMDIEKDRTAFEKYKYLVPVIEINGEVVFTYSVNEDELKKILRRSRPR